jgi:maltooligosyltrehalose synthase
VAFARRHGDTTVIVAVARRARHLLDQRSLLPDPAAWLGTTLRLPDDLAERGYTSALGAGGVDVEHGGIPVQRLFDPMPAAILVAAEPTP